MVGLGGAAVSVYEEAATRLLCLADVRQGEPYDPRANMWAGMWDDDRAEAIAWAALNHVQRLRRADLTAKGSTMIVDAEREAAGLLLAGWRP